MLVDGAFRVGMCEFDIVAFLIFGMNVHIDGSRIAHRFDSLALHSSRIPALRLRPCSSHVTVLVPLSSSRGRGYVCNLPSWSISEG